MRDFAPITLVNTVNLVLTVSPLVQANSVKELIALAKSKPGHVRTTARVGIGSLGHLAALRFAKSAGIDVVQVPYKSAPEVTTALLRGDATLLLRQPDHGAAVHQSGKERALAVTSATRSSVLPDVPDHCRGGSDGLRGAGLERAARTGWHT